MVAGGLGRIGLSDMPQAVPPHYTHLPPFRDQFRKGRPILMYHKLGPRPAGVRLKGLYISASLFAEQMRELSEAGFRTVMPGDPFGNGPEVCLTFDDGYANVFVHGLPRLVEYRMCAIQYLVSGAIGRDNCWDRPAGEVAAPLMDKGQIREWLNAGQAIGSHTVSHARLTEITANQAREEIQSSKKSLEDMFGVAIDHFCYPYGDWNPVIRDLVREAGYRTACTVSGGLSQPDDDPWSLQRIFVRYPTRSPRALWRRVRGRWSG